jgi:hypothetical protein
VQAHPVQVREDGTPEEERAGERPSLLVAAAQVFLAPRLGGIDISTNRGGLIRGDASRENLRHRQIEGMGEAVRHLRHALPVGERGSRAHLVELQSQLLEVGSRIRNIDRNDVDGLRFRKPPKHRPCIIDLDAEGLHAFCRGQARRRSRQG